MSEIKVKVTDLYEIRALILGFSINKEGETTVLYPGFINEKGITEGVKRIANKIAKKFTSEVEGIDKQRKEIQDDKYADCKLSKEEMEEDKKKRENTLLSDEVTINLEEQLDFAKIEHLSLSFNYSLLYDTVFKN